MSNKPTGNGVISEPGKTPSYSVDKYFVTRGQSLVDCIFCTLYPPANSPAEAWDKFLAIGSQTRRFWQTKGKKFKAHKFRVTIEAK